MAFNGLDGHLATSASADLAADLKELAVMLRARMQNEVGAAQQVDLLLAKASAWAQFGNSSDERTRSSSPRRQSCAVMAGVPSRRIDGN